MPTRVRLPAKIPSVAGILPIFANQKVVKLKQFYEIGHRDKITAP